MIVEADAVAAALATVMTARIPAELRSMSVALIDSAGGSVEVVRIVVEL